MVTLLSTLNSTLNPNQLWDCVGHYSGMIQIFSWIWMLNFLHLKFQEMIYKKKKKKNLTNSQFG